MSIFSWLTARSRMWVWFAAAVAFLLALSWVPYQVPVVPVSSVSYLFGYSNRSALLIVSAAAALLFCVGPELPLVASAPAHRPLGPSALKSALISTGLVAVAIFLYTRRLEGWNESIYFVDRVKLVLEGRAPYRDFEFAYGALFLYLPVWVACLCHLSAADAYGVVWISASMIGVWLLYRTLTWMDEEGLQGQTRSLFLLFVLSSIIGVFSTGLNYTLLRFILPCYLAVACHRRMVAAIELPARALAMLLPLPCFAFLLLVSQELALGFAAGVALYLLRFGSLKKRLNAIAFGTLLIGDAALVWIADRCGAFLSLHAFSSGGMNFPVMPSYNILLLFLCTALAVTWAGTKFRSATPSPMTMLTLISAPSLAAALGRCDSGHTLMNPLGISLTGLYLASCMSRLWRWFWPLLSFFVVVVGAFFAALFDVPHAISAWPQVSLSAAQDLRLPRLKGRTLRLLQHSLGEPEGEAKFQSLRALVQGDATIDVDALFRQPEGTRVRAPFGFFPGGFGAVHSPALEEGYFLGTLNLLTPDEVSRKREELIKHPATPILLLPDWGKACVIDPSAARLQVRLLFLYPYNAVVVHPESVTAPLCDYIRDHYRQGLGASAEHFGYELWLPQDK